MVCWLRFLQQVSDALKSLEPDVYARKRLAIDVLKDIEREKGHDVARIKKTIDDEGAGGLEARAQFLLRKNAHLRGAQIAQKFIKKKVRKRRTREEEKEVAVAEE
ncbi:MAG: hypothetical protein AB1468_04025 [Candidatus Micrarchaeota archaeon]